MSMTPSFITPTWSAMKALSIIVLIYFQEIYYNFANKYHSKLNQNDPEVSKKFQEVFGAYNIVDDENLWELFQKTWE